MENVEQRSIFGKTTKVCCRCKRTKDRSEFNKHKTASDGLDSRCKDCIRLIRLHRKKRPDKSIKEKRCYECKEVKPISCFSKDADNSDGYCSRCKDCRREQRKRLCKREPKLPEEKTCSRCGLTKPQNEFERRRKMPDGLNGVCKQCRRMLAKVRYFQKALQKTAKKKPDAKIETWEQVDSIMREMAELQAAINNEKELCNRTIEHLKSDTAKTIMPLVTRQTHLEHIIEDFVRRTAETAKKRQKTFRFGSLTFYRRKLDVRLNVALAKEMVGKP